MAEKKNVEIDRKHAVNVELKIQLEAAQGELEKAYKAANEWKAEYHKVVDSEQALQAELERVKAVAEKMVSRLIDWDWRGCIN